METADGRLVPVVWGEDGLTVWVRWDAGHVLRCTVATAAGDALRVVNEGRGVDRWLPIGACYVREGDAHARPARVSLAG